MDTKYDNMQLQLLGPYIFAPEVLEERLEVYKYYNFFYGKARLKNHEFLNETNRGQSWYVKPGLDFIPTQEIRNHVKRLIKRQARFMFGIAPTITLKGYDKKDNDLAEGLRQFIDNTLFEKNEFWADTHKAFLDCTICKRVLLRVEANPKEPITYHYHSMDEFTYEVDPENYKRLTKVTIAYLEKSTSYMAEDQQIWHRWQYTLHDDGFCYLTSGTYDGRANPIEEEKDINTKFTEIPCKVILNDGLLGDLEGDSDVRDLIDAQNSYNHTNSDYRDALKFRMFEQPVFIDATDESTEDIKIAPNAMINLHTEKNVDDIGEQSNNVKADAKMLSSSFSFVEGANKFTEDLKTDMYELMDQPKPEDIKALTSGKALRMTFYDMEGRCDDKWIAWESAIKWLIHFSVTAIKQLDLYHDKWNPAWNDLEYRIKIKHNYPIPDDEKENKEVAIQEVNANVRSRKSYIREISKEEDYDSEFNTILEENEKLNASQQDMFEGAVNEERDNLNKGKNEEADNKTKSEDKEVDDETDGEEGNATKSNNPVKEKKDSISE